MKKFFYFFAFFVFLSQIFCQRNSSKTSSLSQITKDENLTQESKDENLTQESYVMLANSSKNYPVTAGDIYRLSYVAANQLVNYAIAVDSTYMIKISNLATINARGKTFLELKKQVEDIVNKNYPLAGVQFLIQQVSLFEVAIKGEVVESTAKKMTAQDHLSSIFYDLKTNFSSEREILIKSEDGSEKSYDLYKAWREGDLSQDPCLRPGDEVTVLRAKKLVTINGAVERPGKYELLEGENLRDLIEKYGFGLLQSANISSIEILRTANSSSESFGEKIYVEGKDAIAKNFELLNDDSVLISNRNEVNLTIFLEGAINVDLDDVENLEGAKKVAVNFTENENYAFLVRRIRSSFSAESDLKNSYIKRQDFQTGEVTLIPLDLEKLLFDPSAKSQEFAKPFDTLIVPFRQFFVSVAGAVKNPGRYPYIPARSWEYYIGLAGGFNKLENTRNAVTIVDEKNSRKTKTSEILPEYTITAKSNSFVYYFGIYAPIITTALTCVSTIFTIVLATKN